MDDWRSLPTFSFGDSPALADELAALVLAGVKTASCDHARGPEPDYPVGSRSVMLDGSGRPRCVIETLEVTLRRFDEVGDDLAFDEGEGDRSLRFWRAAHQAYFTRAGVFAENMPLWCERFRVVAVIDDAGGIEGPD
ncbi:ASCH domain-containing protein [Methylobrevis albus]|uniref:ASCH domain-containing protein n=1 Tax=Methylobrevis albus TaxID=2793297 RepID=A0A931HYB5_9HYPH|nr:ASCH domain-containing protein [Methylobrevis albus]MBH0236777.1 ASCH domain-containing protein [Methylobrevis albus]